MNARVTDRTALAETDTGADVEHASAPSTGASSPQPGELDSLLRGPTSQRELPAPTWHDAPPVTTVLLGRIVSIDRQGVPSVDFPGSSGSLPARVAIAAKAQELLSAMQTSRQVVLSFENGDRGLPILLGIVQPFAADVMNVAEPAPSHESAEADAPQAIEVDVDGRRVRIVAQDEILLQCGSASITLRRNGRVVVKGTYIETYSEGTNRIKGGQVRIN
jgi:hypothetical protein